MANDIEVTGGSFPDQHQRQGSPAIPDQPEDVDAGEKFAASMANTEAGTEVPDTKVAADPADALQASGVKIQDPDKHLPVPKSVFKSIVGFVPAVGSVIASVTTLVSGGSTAEAAVDATGPLAEPLRIGNEAYGLLTGEKAIATDIGEPETTKLLINVAGAMREASEVPGIENIEMPGRPGVTIPDPKQLFADNTEGFTPSSDIPNLTDGSSRKR